MHYRHRAVLPALLAVGMLAFHGCSMQPTATAHDGIPSLPFSVVATGDPAIDLQDASTFVWAQGLQQNDADQHSENVSMDTLLQAAISSTLQAKGYRYAAVPGEGDLIVGYHVAYDDVPVGRDREAVDTDGIKLQPSLNLNSPDPSRYEKGTLVIEVTEKSTGLTAWRSALQGFAIRGLSVSERRQRIGLMVDRMLAGMPAK
jgi:hypothetical protein